MEDQQTALSITMDHAALYARYHGAQTRTGAFCPIATAVTKIVVVDDAQAQSFEHRRERVQHHHPCPDRTEHLGLEEDRREKDAERQQHLDDVLDVAKEEVAAADEQRGARGEGDEDGDKRKCP